MGAPLREVFAKFTTEFDPSSLLSGAAAVEGLFGKLKGLGAALAGGAIVGGLAAFTEHVIRQGDELDTTAGRLGVSTQMLQQWQYVANLADVSAEEFSASLRIVQRNLLDAGDSGGEAAKNFAKIGIGAEDLKKGDLDVVLTKSADAFAKMTNPIEKTALAQKIFGRGGAALLPLLSKGAAGVQELKDEFTALGGGLSDETIAAANEADDAFKRLKFGLSSLTKNAVLPLIKFAIYISKVLLTVIKAVQSWTKNTNAIKAALLVLGGVAVAFAAKTLIAFAPLILSTLAWAAAIGIIVLAVDEIITTLEGGDSILRRWIDDTWGAGATDKVIQSLRDAWDSLGPVLSAAWEWLKSILPTVGEISDAFKALGQDIAFVIDQFRHLSEFKEGLAKIGHDIGVKLGISDQTADEKKFANGAAGFGSVSASNTANGIANASRGGVGFTSGFTRFPSEVQPSANNSDVKNNVVINVAANAKPDPELTRHIKGAVQDGLNTQNRKVLASVQGS